MLRKLSMLLVMMTLFMSVLAGSNLASANVNDLSADQVALKGSSCGLAATAAVYVGNTNTYKFHKPGCSYEKKIKHKVYFNSRDEAIQNGYSPCGHCHP